MALVEMETDPMTADCVLIYAQAITDAELAHSDYTLACWNQSNELVPVAKAYQDLDAELNAWISGYENIPSKNLVPSDKSNRSKSLRLGLKESHDRTGIRVVSH